MKYFKPLFIMCFSIGNLVMIYFLSLLSNDIKGTPALQEFSFVIGIITVLGNVICLMIGVRFLLIAIIFKD